MSEAEGFFGGLIFCKDLIQGECSYVVEAALMEHVCFNAEDTESAEKRVLERFYFDEDGGAFAFAALGEPGGKAFGEAFGSEAVASFDVTVGDGERVVKVGGVGEVAHAELVEPVERARLFVALDDDVDGELLRVHTSILDEAGATCAGLRHPID
jgi:hypothetical protein